MKINLCRRAASLFFLLNYLAFSAIAQTPNAPEMATGLRASGKIYVVVVVVVIIIGGLLAYLITLDRKVSQLEQEIKK